jgi:putative membrane protein
MARPAWVVGGLAAPQSPRSPRRRAPLPATAGRVVLAAGALTAWDVFLDPRMTREGYWSWPGGGRYEGVPASNFAGWFVTGLAVFAAYAALARGEPSDEALAFYAWAWIGEAFANAALWGRPRVAIAGAAAMGAFAVPALVRRLAR